MNAAWNTFLVDQDVKFKSHVMVQEQMLCDLSHKGILSVAGEDAETFLQNQLSSDLKQVSETQSQLSSYNTHKGRMIADLYISKRANTFYLQLSHDLVAVLLKKLRMYVMMSKVTLDDVSDQLIYFGYAGSNAAQLLADCIGTIPTQPNETIQYQSLSITRIMGKTSRFAIIGEVQDAQQLWTALAPQASPVSSHTWQYLDIATGLPNINADSSTAWVPQMLNFERIGGISFTKGCYPGQEIVARLNYLGQTKRRTYRLLAQTDQLAAVGDKIIMVNNEGKASEAGQVLNAALNFEGQLEMLAVLKSASIDQSLSWNDIAIEVLELPYTLEDS